MLLMILMILMLMALMLSLQHGRLSYRLEGPEAAPPMGSLLDMYLVMLMLVLLASVETSTLSNS